MAALTIALTGGIATGKTTVANRFAERGAAIIDADIVARELVARGQPALAEITAAFGREMLTQTGELDRRHMRERVLASDAERRRLEAILHPRVRSELLARAGGCTAPYCLLVIPLLAESQHAYDWVDRVLVVDLPRAEQLARLMQRDGMTAALAERSLTVQATREQRLALADDVIDNSGVAELLIDAVERLDRLYLTLSARKRKV
ncbi:MAG TPA: dephospho-CoA kinase [Rudaea sp.]|uniref:dephospho-CoA kinase n=1 Tax=Rudaea sp. TaxID=2136325 RepID=UPI002F950EC6